MNNKKNRWGDWDLSITKYVLKNVLNNKNNDNRSFKITNTVTKFQIGTSSILYYNVFLGDHASQGKKKKMAVDEKCFKIHFSALVDESLLFFSYAIFCGFGAVWSLCDAKYGCFGHLKFKFLHSNCNSEMLIVVLHQILESFHHQVRTLISKVSQIKNFLIMVAFYFVFTPLPNTCSTSTR